MTTNDGFETIRIVAKSANSEDAIVKVLDEVCENSKLSYYQYWYSSGLWMIKIVTTDPESIDIDRIHGELEYITLDFCMIFHNDYELFNKTFVRYRDSRIGIQKMEAPTGETFNLSIPTVEEEVSEEEKPDMHPWAKVRERYIKAKVEQ